MKTLLVFAAGVWVGQKIYSTLADNKAREREVRLRKKLEQFIQDHLPDLSTDEKKRQLAGLIK